MQQSTCALDAPAPAAPYDTDIALWIDAQTALLRARRFDLLDLDNVIEELDGMNRSARAALGHRIEQLMVHLLKCEYQPDHQTPSWIRTVNEQRSRIVHLIRTSPSLANDVQANADQCYLHAVKQASSETRLPRSAFPPNNPYTREQLLDADFIP